MIRRASIALELQGRRIDDAGGLLQAKFNAFPWAWYDGVVSDPNRIEPVDFAITVAMNSRATAARMASFLRQSSRVEPWLQKLPPDVDLAHVEDSSPIWSDVRCAFQEACSASGTKLSVASKVLHRKRPRLIPILDRVVADQHYWRALVTIGADRNPPEWLDHEWLKSSDWRWDPTRYMRVMRGEILENRESLRRLRGLAPDPAISEVRLLESVLFWSLVSR